MTQSPLPRVAAAHDLSGFGKCALTVAIPVLSACGVEVCPLPTAILSAHTGFPHFTMVDFTPQLPAYLDSWEKLNLRFDALYSGFLGSLEQIDTMMGFIERFAPGITIVDPVMGDHGALYKTYTPPMCQRLKALVARADLTCPNLTEACLLADEHYRPDRVSVSDTRRMAEKIRLLGAKTVLITGVERENALVNCVCGDEGYWEREYPLLPYTMHGTGDLFASVLTGGLLRGHALPQSLHSAASFVAYAMEQSVQYPGFHERGICFEPLLYHLQGGLFRKDRPKRPAEPFDDMGCHQ